MAADFHGRRLLVTGAAGGIGAAVVTMLCERGAQVTMADVDEGALRTLQERLAGYSGQVYLVPGNLADPDYCDDLPGQALELMGGLDGLVNNAGVMRRGPITDATDEDFMLSMAVNVEAHDA